jgi:hypothetical protein
MRKLKTVGLVLAMYAIALVMELVMVTGSADYEGGIGLLVILPILGIVGPKVGYRWFDCFFAMIPIYGIFFIFRLAYRLANLPNVDWKIREI